MKKTHLELSGAPDLVKMMEAFSTMGPDALESAQRQIGEMVDRVQAASSRDGLIQHFLKARDETAELVAKAANLYQVSTTHSYNVKPVNSGGTLNGHAPLVISQLVLDTTHRGRYLPGRVAVADSFRRIKHVYMLLEDIKGDLVQVCVYNTNRIYRLGEEIAIVEPFFKVAADLMPMIRVDQPSEIVAWNYPNTWVQWKELGNDYFKDSYAQFAIFCYEKGLDTSEISENRSELSLLLNNIAICESRLGNIEKSVWFAGTSVFLNRGNTKAWYRLLDCVQRVDVDCAKEVMKEAPDSPDLQKLVRKIGSSKPTSISSKADKSAFTGFTAWSATAGAFSFAPPTSSPSKVHTQEGWAELRDRARTLFSQSKFDEARDLFVDELQRTKDTLLSIAILTANMGAAYIMQKDFADAMMFSTVSVMLNRDNLKPWIRRGQVIAEVRGPELAVEYFQSFLDDPAISDNSFVASCQRELARLEEKASACEKVKQVCDQTTEEQLSDRRSRTYIENDDQGIDQYIVNLESTITFARLVFSRDLCNDLGPNLRHCKDLALRTCPKIHDEYSKNVGWASGLEAELVRKILCRGHLNASSHPWMIAMAMLRGQYKLTPTQVLKRWNGPHNARLFEAMKGSVEIGSIIDAAQIFFGDSARYDPTIRSIFINTPCNPLAKLTHGSIHISIGFNDLGELLSYPTAGSKSKPIRFVAVDRSEFCVARSLVVREMLMNPSIPIEHVYQVWYSTIWTRSAFDSFRRACREALVLETAKASSNISSFIHCWLSEDPPTAAESRKRWFDIALSNNGKNFADACSFLRLRDRLAILKYLTTGELIPSAAAGKHEPAASKGKRENKQKVSSFKETASVGSMVFWNVPPNSSPLESDSIFNTISLEVLIKNSLGNESVVDTIKRLKLEQLTTLRERLLRGRILLDIRCFELRPDTPDAIAEIASLRPTTMSWSNLVDYYNHEAFHSMAKQFKASRHYGYSMNWPVHVYGMFITDYEDDMLTTEQLLVEAFQKRPHPLLTKPHFDTPLNLVSHNLVSKMKHFWMDYFARGQARIVRNTVLEDNTLYRNSNVVYMEWTYET